VSGASLDGSSRKKAVFTTHSLRSFEARRHGGKLHENGYLFVLPAMGRRPYQAAPSAFGEGDGCGCFVALSRWGKQEFVICVSRAAHFGVLFAGISYRHCQPYRLDVDDRKASNSC